MGAQERALKAGVDIIVATPGRLMDHMRSRTPDFTRRRAARARRSRPHDGHGLLARRPAHHRDAARSDSAPDAALLGDDAGRSGEAGATRSCATRKYVQVGSASGPAKSITHTRRDRRRRRRRSSGWRSSCAAPHGPVLVFSRTKIGADRLARKLAAAGIQCRGAARRSHAGAATRGGRRLPRRPLQRARRDRHRRARPRHRRHHTRRELRSAAIARHLRAPRRPHRPRRRDRHGAHAGRARGARARSKRCSDRSDSELQG